jgi:hypothetical protein
VDCEPRHYASKDTLSELDFAHICKCVLGWQTSSQNMHKIDSNIGTNLAKKCGTPEVTLRGNKKETLQTLGPLEIWNNVKHV